jgi:phage terminase large subunit-like protein
VLDEESSLISAVLAETVIIERSPAVGLKLKELLQGATSTILGVFVWFVEDTQYQHAAIEEMERRAFSVQGMRPIKDKQARLRVAARYIKNGTVKFPRKDAEQLITQLVGLGIEKHDDLCDACVWLILGLVGDAIEEQKVYYA